MAVLLIAEVNNGALATDAVAKALTAVKPLGEVHVLVAGEGGDAAAAEAATLDGVAKVLFAGDHALCHGLAEPTAALVVSLAPAYGHIAAASTAFAKNLLPRVAALLDVMVLSDVTGVVSADTFERPIYAGNAIQTVQSSDRVKVLTVRTASFSAAGAEAGGAAPVELVGGAADPGLSSGGRGQGRGVGPAGAHQREDRRLGRARRRPGGEFRADREARRQARGGGRRQPGRGRFRLRAERLARRSGRPARSSSLAHRHRHLRRDPAPRRDEGKRKVTVAIVKDEEAPIFQVADYGLVGDPFQIVPELEKKLG